MNDRTQYITKNRKGYVLHPDCHCEKCESTTKQSTLSKWIATLVSLARNDSKCRKTKREKNILFWGQFGHCLSTKQNIFDRLVIRRASFTLAEVLITLTIIGVIAAITIPNLMQKYKKHQVEVQLKAAYSLLSNAIQIADVNNDHIISDTILSDRSINVNEFANYIKPYLKCSSSSDRVTGLSDRTLPTGFSYNTVRFLDDSYSENIGRKYWGGYSTCVLANGMYLGIGNISDNARYDFQIDINGGKEPNRYGHDVFVFSVDRFQGKFALGAGPNGKYFDVLKRPDNYCSGCTINTLYKICKPEYSYECAIPIMQNGWKIPDEYPVKKW